MRQTAMTMVVMLCAAVFLALLPFGAEAEKPQGPDFFQMDSQVISVRYGCTWDNFDPSRATVWPVNTRIGQPVSDTGLRRQDRRLNRIGGVDAYQIGPLNERGIANLQSTCLEYSDRPFVLLIEHQSVPPGFYIRDEYGKVDLSKKHNRKAFISIVAKSLKAVEGYEDRFACVSVDGECLPIIVLWAANSLSGAGYIEKTLNDIRQRFGVFIISGMLSHEPPLPTDAPEFYQEKIEVIAGSDAITNYAVYTPDQISYREMVQLYRFAVAVWLEEIKKHSPRTVFIPAFTPGFDDRLYRGGEDGVSPNSPKIPRSLAEVRELADLVTALVRNNRQVRGVLIVLDEPFEGMAVDRNIRHIRPFLEGNTLLRLIRSRIVIPLGRS